MLPEDSTYNVNAIAKNLSYLYVGLSDHDLFDASAWYAGGILRSTDRGTTWSRASEGLPKKNGVHVPVLHMYADDELQLATTLEGLYRSTDGGDNWERTNYGNQDEHPMNPIYFQRIGNAHYAASTRAIYRTTDVGASWTKVGGDHDFIINIGRFEDSLFIIRSNFPNYTMYRLRETGGSSEWIDISERLPQGLSPLVVLEGGLRAYLGTIENGVWVLRKPVAGVDEEEVASAHTYPNPANDHLTIDLAEKMSGKAAITVRDLSGREVLKTDTQVMNGSIYLMTGHLPAGQFSYIIQLGSRSVTGNLTIQR